MRFEIWVMNADGSAESSLTPQEGDEQGKNWFDVNPSWSPDGKTIVFQSDRDGNYEIYTLTYDEDNPLAATPVRLTFHGADDEHPAWGK